jgi:hypothetical protein
LVEDRTLQHVLANLSDLVTNEHVQIEEPKPFLVENANFEFIEFEPINNYLTQGSIIRIDVHVQYNNDVFVEFNCVPNCNDHTFSEKPIKCIP